MKRLVVCFDGTWNNADSDKAETNVTRMARAIRASPENSVPQTVLYLRGVGSAGLEVQRLVEGAIGLGVDDNIRSAYMFLAQNYVPGDEIFLFGFSRGAFTARSLAGFIGAAGLLKRNRLQDLGNAWTYYRRTDVRTPGNFCKLHNSDCHVDVTITFLGVWDTVGALGIPSHLLSFISQQQYGFHDTTPSRIVKHGCHALAIDEHRDEFVPTLWTGKAPDGCKIEQVWFAGAHSDVGGGYKERALADIPLVWMAEKAEASGLVLDWTCLPDRTKLDYTARRHDARNGWSSKDILTPTFRRICEANFDVSLFEAIYAPRDQHGQIQNTINESVHESAVARFGQKEELQRETTVYSQQFYRPRNLEPLIAPADMPPPHAKTSPTEMAFAPSK